MPESGARSVHPLKLQTVVYDILPSGGRCRKAVLGVCTRPSFVVGRGKIAGWKIRVSGGDRPSRDSVELRTRCWVSGGGLYWVVQAGLLTPLIFALHRFSPLADFLLVGTFFTMEGDNNKFAKFTVVTLLRTRHTK